MEHPPPDLLLRFRLGSASPPENRQVVRHLLARCPACAAALRQLRHEPPLSLPPSPEDYAPAIGRAVAFVRELLQKSTPDAEADHRRSSAASGNAACRRWLIG